MIGVYKIEHSPTGRFYVGHSVSIGKRWSVHVSKLRRGVHHCAHLQHAWSLYGEEEFGFHVIAQCASQTEAAQLEQGFLDAHFAAGGLFNSLSVNTPLLALNEARQRAYSPESQAKRVQTTLRNGTWCAGQRVRVRAGCLATGITTTYESVRAAARALRISAGNIVMVCKGVRNTAGGFTFWHAFDEGDHAAA